jgi:hypothetical protein
LRVIEAIISKIKPLKLKKAEEAVVGVDRTIETTAIEIKVDHMTCVLIALNPIPWAAISAMLSFWSPWCNLRICKRMSRSRLVDYKAILELQQGWSLIFMTKWLQRRQRACE